MGLAMRKHDLHHEVFPHYCSCDRHEIAQAGCVVCDSHNGCDDAQECHQFIEEARGMWDKDLYYAKVSPENERREAMKINPQEVGAYAELLEDAGVTHMRAGIETLQIPEGKIVLHRPVFLTVIGVMVIMGAALLAVAA